MERLYSDKKDKLSLPARIDFRQIFGIIRLRKDKMLKRVSHYPYPKGGTLKRVSHYPCERWNFKANGEEQSSPFLR